MNDVWVSINKWTFFEKKNITINRYKQDKKFWNEIYPKKMFANTGYCREKNAKVEK